MGARSLAAALAAAVVLSGCQATQAEPGRITVGLVVSLSGASQAVGEATRDGFALYLSSHGGRLGGHPVDLVVVDEADGGAVALQQATTLIADRRPLALTGVTLGETVTALLPILRQHGVPVVGSNGRPRLDDVSLVWSTSFRPEEPGRAIAEYLHESVGGPVWAMAADDQSAREYMAGFVDAFTADGGQIGNNGQPLYTSTTNVLPALAQARANGAKAIYAHYVGTEAVSFVQQYAQSDARGLPLFAAGFMTEGRVLAAEGRSALGVQTVLNYASDLDNPANRDFVDAWLAQHNTLPTTYAMASWDAALVLDKAIAAAGPDPTPAAVNKAIGGVGQVNSPRGVWVFSPQHSPVQKWYLRRVQTDGRTFTNSLIQDLDILGA